MSHEILFAPSRRNFLLGALGLAVSGCGENLIGSDLVTAFRYATTGLPGPEITRELVNGIPYASLAVKIGQGPRSLLILWKVDGEVLTWMSADDVALLTHNGRLVRTVGLPSDMTIVRFPVPDPLGLPLGDLLTRRSHYSRIIDFVDRQAYGIEIVSSLKVVGPRKIRITSIEFDTILVEENCRATQLNWQYKNRFWLDPVDGFVWKSEQVSTRDTPSMTVEVLKPPELG